MLELVAAGVLALPLMITALFFRNLWLFQRAAAPAHGPLPPVSILIPARNEAEGIQTTLQAILQHQESPLEVVVLDDHSDDRTAEIVRQLSANDPRLRLELGSPLPPGWCGKQFACHQLATHARHDTWIFLDADVRLQPMAVPRLLATFRRNRASLLSGFPRQIVATLGEALLLPLIHVVLLCYLPFDLMKRTRSGAAAAGCGQLFITTRHAYHQMGGHAAIKASLHDGITLPRAYRAHGLATDVFDASDLAMCRMYHGWIATWLGLLKNAHEGMAHARAIVPATLLMTLTTVVPVAFLVHVLIVPSSGAVSGLACLAVTLSYLPRLVCAARFDRAWTSCLLFPVSCVLFLTLQWYAYGRHCLGVNSAWRGRQYTHQESPPVRTAA